MNVDWRIREATEADFAAWGALRARLWDDSAEDVRDIDDMRQAIDPSRPATTFLAIAGDAVIGFIEVALRHDYVNGTDGSPVGFVEGWLVDPAWQRHGIGRALVRAAEHWTRAQGCSELASDSWLDATDAHAAHRACGFEETERVVYFRKALDGET